MAFLDSIKSTFFKYVDFNGRASRTEYWYFVLAVVIVDIITAGIDNLIGFNGSGPISWIVSLALLLPGLGVAVRRLHDIDKSGWWLLLGLIPLVGALILIFAYLIKPSQQGDNRFGPQPVVPAAGGNDQSVATPEA